MIKINNLTKVYKMNKNQDIKALDNVSFEISKGEVINVIGKSGSGKTTLSNILLGIIKPTDGSFVIDDINVDKKTKKRKLRLITNTLLSSFQYPTHQLFTKTVEEEILFNSDNNKERMNELIKLLSFPKELLMKSPFRLSSGQKRKVILMSLLMQQPDILVFDEATAFLDAASRKDFINVIKKVNKELNTTMVFISHNLVDAEDFSNRTILLDKGKVISDGDTKEVIKKYLGGDF